MQLPQDPFILLSTINTMLRDNYSSLEDLCKSEGIEQEEITKTLATAGFEYSKENNKFW